MKKYFSILFSLLSCYSFSQTAYTGYIPFPEDSAQWSQWFNTPSTGFYSLQYKMIGDTLINGISYNKIYTSSQLNYWANDTPQIHCFIRQDTALKKVYARYPYSSYQDSSEFVLYDFSVHIGDTIFVHVLPNHIDYPVAITCEDTAPSNIDYRRYLCIYVLDTCAMPGPGNYCLWGSDCDHSQSWGEGIGSNIHFLYPEIAKDSCVYGVFNLECFWHNGQYVFGGTFCDYQVGITPNNRLPGKEIFLFPNPVINFSVLDVSSVDCRAIEIFSAKGSLVKRMDGKNTIVTIRAEDFENGIYFIRVKSKDNAFYLSRMIVLR
jgi:hypothetical protein